MVIAASSVAIVDDAGCCSDGRLHSLDSHRDRSVGISVNRGVVEIETSGTAGISVKMTGDLANLIVDGANRRVMPVVGKGSLQTLTDLRYTLSGINMAILQTDVLVYSKEHRLYPSLQSSLILPT